MAIGEMKMTPDDMYDYFFFIVLLTFCCSRKVNSGIAIEMIHYLGDELFTCTDVSN